MALFAMVRASALRRIIIIFISPLPPLLSLTAFVTQYDYHIET